VTLTTKIKMCGRLGACDGIVLVEREDQLSLGCHRFAIQGRGLKTPSLDGLQDNLVQPGSHPFDEILADHLPECVDADINDDFLFGGREESAVRDGGVGGEDGERGVDVLGVATIAVDGGGGAVAVVRCTRGAAARLLEGGDLHGNVGLFGGRSVLSGLAGVSCELVDGQLNPNGVGTAGEGELRDRLGLDGGDDPNE